MKDVGIKISFDNREAKKDAREVQEETEKIGTEAKKAGDKVERNLTSGFKGLKASLLSVKGVATGFFATLGGHAFVSFSNEMIQTADHLAKTSDKLGLTTERLQEYRFAASQSGIDTRRFDMAFQRFGRRIAEVANEQGELLKTAKQYNLQVKDTHGQIRDINEIFGEYADLIKNASSDQEALRLAFKAFDSEGAVMVNMLRDGKKGLEEWREEAQRLDLIIGDKLLRSSEEVTDQFDKFEKQLKATFSEAVLRNANLILGVMNSLSSATGLVSEVLDDWSELGELTDFLQGQGAWTGLKSGQIWESFFDSDRMIELLRERADELGIILPKMQEELYEKISKYPTRGSRPKEKTFMDEWNEKEKRLKEIAEAERTLEEQLAAEREERRRAEEEWWERHAASIVGDDSENRRRIKERTDWMMAERKRMEDYETYLLLERYKPIEQVYEEEPMAHVDLYNKKMIEKAKETAEAKKDIWEDLSDKVRDVSHDMSGAFADFAVGAEVEVKQLITSLTREFIRFGAQKFLFGPLFSAIGGVFGSEAHAGGEYYSQMQRKIPVLHNGLAGNEYLAVLERGEKVQTKEEVRNEKGTNVQVIVQSPPGYKARVEEKSFQMGDVERQFKVMFAEDIAQRGIIARTFENSYGMKPVGRRF